MNPGKSLIVVLLGLILSGTVVGASPHLEVALGYSGFHRPGEWVPVRVVLENLPRADRQEAPKSYDGTVEVTADAQGGATQAVLYSHPVNLAANDRKVVWIYCRFPSVQNTARVRFMVDREEITAKDVEVKPLDAAESLVVVVRSSDEAVALPSLSRSSKVEVVYAEPDAIPPTWQGLASCDLLILNRASERLLADKRPAAIRQFVVMGGNVLVTAGRWTGSWQGTEFAEWLPVDLKGQASYRIEDGSLAQVDGATSGSGSTGTYLLAESQLRPDSRVHFESGGVALLVSRPLGNGQVFLWAADWQNSLFSLLNLPRVMSSWLASRTNLDVIRQQINDRFLYTDYSGLLGGGAAGSLPSPTMIFWILLAYFVLIGPLNFVILWRKKKLEWAWITIPAVVLVFGVGLLVAGRALRGGQVIWRTFEFVTATAGQSQARSEILAMHFSAFQGESALAKPAEGVAQSVHGTWNRGVESARISRMVSASLNNAAPPSENSEFTVSSELMQPWVSRLPLRQWDSVYLRSESPVDLGGSVEGGLEVVGTSMTIEIHNKTGRALNQPFIAIGNRSWPVAERLDAGASVTVVRTFNEPTNLVGQVSDSGSEPFESVQKSADKVLKTCIVEPNYAISGPMVHDAILVAGLSRPYQELSAPESATDFSEHPYLIMRLPMALNGPLTRQWFGSRPLTAEVQNYGYGGDALENVPMRPRESTVFALRGFERSPKDRNTDTLLQIRINDRSDDTTETGSRIQADALDHTSGRWVRLSLRPASRDMPITTRSGMDFSRYSGAYNNARNKPVDFLLSIPAELSNPLGGGSVVRFDVSQPTRIVGPIQRLMDFSTVETPFVDRVKSDIPEPDL